ncbi:MAG: hypothetical protein FWG72_09435, partial [Oscillospiraceae bacterium]|nr:hypothetical protein [Oscillospiraceae bacterium]
GLVAPAGDLLFAIPLLGGVARTRRGGGPKRRPRSGRRVAGAKLYATIIAHFNYKKLYSFFRDLTHANPQQNTRSPHPAPIPEQTAPKPRFFVMFVFLFL